MIPLAVRHCLYLDDVTRVAPVRSSTTTGLRVREKREWVEERARNESGRERERAKTRVGGRECEKEREGAWWKQYE